MRYATERTLRGQPIGRFQMTQSDIAEMATAIEASRALVYEAASLMDQALPSNRIAAIATRRRRPSSAPIKPCRSSVATDLRKSTECPG